MDERSKQAKIKGNENNYYYALVNQIPQYPLFGDYRGIVGDLTFRPCLGGGGFDTNEGILLNACALC